MLSRFRCLFLRVALVWFVLSLFCFVRLVFVVASFRCVSVPYVVSCRVGSLCLVVGFLSCFIVLHVFCVCQFSLRDAARRFSVQCLSRNNGMLTVFMSTLLKVYMVGVALFCKSFWGH